MFIICNPQAMCNYSKELMFVCKPSYNEYVSVT